MKYIICDFAKSNWGKTKTLLEVIKQLKEKATLCVEDQIDGEDKYVVFDLKGKKVVVNTQGDPDGYYKKGLQRAVDENADIILCASREKGKTKTYVTVLLKRGTKSSGLAIFLQIMRNYFVRPTFIELPLSQLSN